MGGVGTAGVELGIVRVGAPVPRSRGRPTIQGVRQGGSGAGWGTLERRPRQPYATAASLSRLARGAREVDVAGKEGELALLLVRLYRSLDPLNGGDEAKNREWLHAENHHLGGKPSELIRSIQGLVYVVEYLDAMRGRL